MILGFAVMILVQLVEINGEDVEDLPTKVAHHSCVLDLEMVANLSLPVNITCFNGQIQLKEGA